MKFAYFGAFNSGKNHLQLECQHNFKSYIRTRLYKNCLIFNSIREENNKQVLDIKRVYETTVEYTTQDAYIYTSADNFSEPKETYKKLIKERLKHLEAEKYKSPLLSKKRVLEYFDDISRTHLWIPMIDWDSVDILDHYESPPDIKDRNVYVPYKEDLVDSYISKANNIINLETRSRAEIFNKLDMYTRMHRQMELALRRSKIDYSYFNLDRDSYTVFELTPKVERKYTYFNTWSKIEESTQRNVLLRNIAEEYLSDRNIVDMRLTGAAIDGLHP